MQQNEAYSVRGIMSGSGTFSYTEFADCFCIANGYRSPSRSERGMLSARYANSVRSESHGTPGAGLRS